MNIRELLVEYQTYQMNGTMFHFIKQKQNGKKAKTKGKNSKHQKTNL